MSINKIDFAGALTVAVMMAFVFTYGFSIEPGAIGQKIATIGEARTLVGLLSSFVACYVIGWFRWGLLER